MPVMIDNVQIERGSAHEAVALARLFFNAVRDGAPAYTPAERAAWAPAPKSGSAWKARLTAQTIMLARDADGPVGFMTLMDTGYIDLAYILAAYQGRGLFPRLYWPLERVTRITGHTHVSTHASLMARSAFEKVGFKVVQAENVEIEGERLRRFEMVKSLTTSQSSEA